MSGDFLPRPNDEGGGGAVGQMIQLEPTPSTRPSRASSGYRRCSVPCGTGTTRSCSPGSSLPWSATSSTWSHSHSWSWATPACGSWAWS